MSSGLIPGGFYVVSQLIAPSGTRTIFHQAAAPLGWTMEVGSAYSDTDLRVNNVSPSSGGSTVWSQWNSGATFNCNAIGLSVSQLPVHDHSVSDPGHVHSMSGGGFVTTGGGIGANGNNLTVAFSTASSTSTTTTAWTSGFTGSGGSFTPAWATPILKFSDHIIGIKS